MVHPSARHCYCRESFPKSAKISGPRSGRFIFTLFENTTNVRMWISLCWDIIYNARKVTVRSGLSHDLARSSFGACPPGESLTFDTSKYDVGISWGFLCFLCPTTDSESRFLLGRCNFLKITPPRSILNTY